MKWLALLGGVFLLVVWLVLRGAPDAADATVKQQLPVPAAPAAANAPPPVVVQSPVGEPAPATPPIVLRGVIFRGAGSDQSQALLSVSGQAAQVFRGGEVVDQGWRLESIHTDHVIVAKDGATTRLNVVGEAGSALAAASGASTAKEKPLPGFTKGPPPSASLSTARSHEQNQRFLRDRQKRLDGTGAASR